MTSGGYLLSANVPPIGALGDFAGKCALLRSLSLRTFARSVKKFEKIEDASQVESDPRPGNLL